MCWVPKLLIMVMFPCSDSTIPQGKFCTLGWLLPGCEVLQFKDGFFLSREEFLSVLLSRDSPLLWGLFLPTFQFSLRGNCSQCSCKYLSFCDWLISHSVISRFMYVIASIGMSFLQLKNATCTYILPSAYPPILPRALGLLPCFSYFEHHTMKWSIQISLQNPAFNYLGYKPRNGIAGWYGNTILNFLRKYHTVSHRSCTILLCQEHSDRVSITPLPHHQVLFPFLLFLVCLVAILVSVRWSVILAFILIFLMISNVEHLFKKLVFSVLYFVWRNIYLRHLPIFELGCVFVFWRVGQLYILSRYRFLTRYMTCKYVIPFFGSLFTLWILSFNEWFLKIQFLCFSCCCLSLKVIS